MLNRNTIGLTICFCFALSARVVALPCSLTEADYQALQNTTEKSYAKSDIEALEPKDQEALCKARKFYREARADSYVERHSGENVPIFDPGRIWPGTIRDERGDRGGLHPETDSISGSKIGGDHPREPVADRARLAASQAPQFLPHCCSPPALL